MKKITDYGAYWQTVVRRFWNGVDVRGKDDCWPWKRSMRNKKCGYGQFQFISKSGKKKSIGTHKFAYVVTKGVVPKGMLVCHTCDNPPCCNPEHLFSGTYQDNVQDARNKNRHGKMDFEKGERNQQAILSSDQVIEIRRLYAYGGYTQRSLGARFNVDWRTIGEIVRRERWAHLGP